MGTSKMFAVIMTVGVVVGACTQTVRSESEEPVATTSSKPPSSVQVDSKTSSTPVPALVATVPGPVATEVIVRQRRDDLGPQHAMVYEPTEPRVSETIVVLLHGAGTNRGSLKNLAEAISKLGVVVVNADWLASHSFPRESVSDVVCAVAFAEDLGHRRTEESEYQPRVIVVGHSGGGQVGMLAALGPDAFSEWCDTTRLMDIPWQSVWAYVGLAGEPTAATDGNAHDFWKDDPEILAAMDAYTHLGGNPNLIVRFLHGTDDVVVPPERTRAFHDAMLDAGYDSEFIQIDGVGHNGIIAPDSRAAGRRVLGTIADLIAAAP